MQSNPSSSFTSPPSWAQSQQGPPLDPFQRSTQSYQSGYLMSAVQGNPMPSNNQRFDNPALLPTKAKAHHLAHATSDDYGSDSLFDRPKARHAMDEDAPPVNSVADIISQAQPDPFARKIGSNTDSPRRLGMSSSSRAVVPSSQSLSHSHSQSLSTQRQPEVTFVLVFGFPPEQYSAVASTFASADASTPERASDTTNWFKIGYRSNWDAQRALRRNGEVVDGLFMIGVVAVDAEMNVSAPVPRPPSVDLASPGLGRSQTFTTFGTPIALAPSHSAFRPPSAAPSGGAKPASTSPVFAAPEQNQGAGWTSKISDAIFGW